VILPERGRQAARRGDEARIRKVFKRVLAHAKLPAFLVYDLRHTFASLLPSERADHVRERTARAREPVDDPAFLRALDSE